MDTPDKTDWRAEAQFWRTRYLELQQQTSMVIAALSRPVQISDALQDALVKMQATKEAEKPEDGQPPAQSCIDIVTLAPDRAARRAKSATTQD